MSSRPSDAACPHPAPWQINLWPDMPGAVWAGPVEAGAECGQQRAWPDVPGAVWSQPPENRDPDRPGRNELPTDHPSERSPHGRKPEVPPVKEPGEPIPQRMPGQRPPGRRAVSWLRAILYPSAQPAFQYEAFSRSHHE